LVSLPVQLSAATAASKDDLKALPGTRNQEFLASQFRLIEEKPFGNYLY